MWFNIWCWNRYEREISNSYYFVKIPQQLAMGGVTKVGANCINCMLAFKERLPLALPGFCGKKGGKLFEARWLQSNFCTFVPSNFLQSAFLTITLSTVYEACGNVQLISRKTEQSNSGGATKKKQGWGFAGFYLRIFLLSLLSSELIKLWVPPPHLLPRRLPVLHGWLCHCQLPEIKKEIRREITKKREPCAELFQAGEGGDEGVRVCASYWDPK